MNGAKTFINNTLATLQITLYQRLGTDPANLGNVVSFVLLPLQTQTITYGDEQNPFLNGLYLYTFFNGDTYLKMQYVAIAESPLDNLLNTNDMISFSLVEADIVTYASNPSLDAVNAAQTTAEMRAALEDPALGLDLTAYDALTSTEKDQVAATVLANRPLSGYPSVASVQQALDEAINELVDPNNIYVSAGAVGGDGSQAHPFGTIQAGIAAVNPEGTVHILAGTYPITSQIVVNKTGITLQGEPGASLLLQADLIAILVTAGSTTISGLEITSDIPYAKEFIQVGGNDTTLLNNTIFGPAQALPMSNWVVNRAVVPQVSITNLTVQSNTFFSLRTGIYINPNVTGAINNNVVYNTKGGFLVDRAVTTFNGNSWGSPSNEFDIVLLVGTTMGPPYDNLQALSAANSNATISDQR
ncbi:hypothetical protein [Tumebacillus lipolyticus]|uniref:DUF1565 domain-containing protein n=1 Tax=Tumebacillus lipolyticus TaxID=1280370 RepID=A0ABW4ZYX1_9BACL